jgi:hypothetical protein
VPEDQLFNTWLAKLCTRNTEFRQKNMSDTDFCGGACMDWFRRLMSGKPAEIKVVKASRIARMQAVYTRVQTNSDLTKTSLTPSEHALTERAGNLAKVWPEQAVVLDESWKSKKDGSSKGFSRVTWIDGNKDTGDRRVLDFLRTALAAPPFIPGSGLLLGFPMDDRRHGIAIFRNPAGAYSFFDPNFGIYTCSELGKLFGTLALILLDGYDFPLESAAFKGSWIVFAPAELAESAKGAATESDRSRDHLMGVAITSERFIQVLKDKRLEAVTKALHEAEWAVQRSRAAKLHSVQKDAEYASFRIAFRAKDFHTDADEKEQERIMAVTQAARGAFNAAEQERERLEVAADQLRVAAQMPLEEAGRIRAAAGPQPSSAARAAAK